MFLLFLVAIGLLFVGRADPTLFERWRTRIVDVSAPVLETLSWPVNAVRNGTKDLGDFWNVYEENERLKKEIADLKVWQAAARHYERQIAHYEQLMKVQPRPGIEYVTARLIADGGSPFKHTFILNAGAKQGITNGQGVVDGLDLIGRVVNVGQQSSRVLRVTDINSRIPVMVEPSRQRAIMAGDNSNLPKLEFVESELDIRAGDRVVTSGDGGLLPAGLPIGIVVQHEAGKFRVRPNTSNGRFESVRVIRFHYTIDVDSSDTDRKDEQKPADEGEGVPKPGTAGTDGAEVQTGRETPTAAATGTTEPSQSASTPKPRRKPGSKPPRARAAQNGSPSGPSNASSKPKRAKPAGGGSARTGGD